MFDNAALPLLLEVMRAANLHDAETVDASTREVLDIIARQPRHKSRADVMAAREHAGSGEWSRCWAAAYQAICGLTHAFPPDLSTCPPVPDDAAPRSARRCAPCGTDRPSSANFCPACGTALTTVS